MFKKLEERSNTLSRDTQDKYKIQIKFLEMKTTKSEMKNTLGKLTVDCIPQK